MTSLSRFILTLFALIFCVQGASIFADENIEDQLIRQLNDWELKRYQFEKESQKAIDQLFQTIDRQKNPRAWLHAYVMAEHEADLEDFSQKIDANIQQAIDWKDLALLFRLVTWKVGELKAQGAPESEFLKTFGKAESFCPEDSRSVWCGRLYDHWAFYYYDANDKAPALNQSQKAIAILQRVAGPDTFYLHDAQTTLSNIFAANVQTLEQAIKLTLANYEWYDQNNFHSLASSEARNLTVYLGSRGNKDYIKEALQWLDKAEFHSKATGTDHHMAPINYSRSLLMFDSEKYLEAIKYAEIARELYTKRNTVNFIALCEIKIARSLIKLKRIVEANAALDRAEKVVPSTYTYQHLMILEVRFLAAEAQGGFEQAFKLLKIYHKKWEAMKGEEAKKGMNRLNAELGLKLEEERTEKLLKENELQKQKIREADVIRVFVIVLSILSISTLGFLIFALRQSKLVKTSHRKMQRILDNIDEGLLTFDRTRRINDDYSKRLPEILGSSGSLVGQDIMQVIFASSEMPGEEQSMIHEILEATFQEDRIAWDLNSENLCREIHFDNLQGQVIELRWIPIFDEQNRLERLLLSLIDTTEKKALEKAFGQQTRYLQALPDTLKEMLVGQPQHIARLLDATQEILEKMQTDAMDTALLRGLHTQKGTARALGLKALSQDLHDLETILHPKTGHTLGQSLQDQLKGIQDRLIEYRAISEVLKNTQRSVSADHNSLAHTLQAHIPSWLEQMEKGGQRLHKLTIADGVLRWHKDQLQMLENICVHAVNNCLDHGFLEADSPIKMPEIEIAVSLHAGSIHLDICDNGQGLNLEQLGRLAKARGFVPTGTETIADVVFCDGFSLAKTLSMSSGRGMGLAAVKELIEKNGGEVRLQNRQQSSGSILRATWPLLALTRQVS